MLQEYNFEDSTTNKSFYKDENVKKLIRTVLRNKIVDYVEAIFEEKEDEMLLGINESGFNTINEYSKKMRKESTWGSAFEAKIIMCDISNCSITIIKPNNKLFYELTPLGKRLSSHIKIFYTGNHYKFYLKAEDRL